MYLHEHIGLWFQKVVTPWNISWKAAFRVKTVVSPRNGYKGSFASQKDEQGQYWGLLLVRLMNPSVQGESSPPWLLLALKHWFFDRGWVFFCTEHLENRPQSPWHPLETRSEGSGCKSNNVSTKDWNLKPDTGNCFLDSHWQYTPRPGQASRTAQDLQGPSSESSGDTF